MDYESKQSTKDVRNIQKSMWESLGKMRESAGSDAIANASDFFRKWRYDTKQNNSSDVTLKPDPLILQCRVLYALCCCNRWEEGRKLALTFFGQYYFTLI